MNTNDKDYDFGTVEVIPFEKTEVPVIEIAAAGPGGAVHHSTFTIAPLDPSDGSIGI